MHKRANEPLEQANERTNKQKEVPNGERKQQGRIQKKTSKLEVDPTEKKQGRWKQKKQNK